MKCPKCEREMEDGYLQSDCHGITWVKKSLPLGVGYWGTDSIYVSTEGNVGTETVKAYICKK